MYRLHFQGILLCRGKEVGQLQIGVKRLLFFRYKLLEHIFMLVGIIHIEDKTEHIGQQNSKFKSPCWQEGWGLLMECNLK